MCRFPPEVVMGRPRKWNIHKLERNEVALRERFLESLEKLVSSSNIRERLRQDWELFLRLNLLEPSAHAIRLFMADLALSLAPSSAHEYASKLSTLPALKQAPIRAAWAHVCRLLNVRAADADLRTATKIESYSCARRALAAVANETERNALRLMLVLGPRAKDLTHLRIRQLDIPILRLGQKYKKRCYRAHIRIAKNRKSLGRRVVLNVPADMREVVREEANRLGHFLRNAARRDDDSKIFSRCSASVLNNALKRACEVAQLPRYTTYSFRRLYIAEIIRQCKRNFSRVRDHTLHFAEETIKAYYDAF